MVFAFLFRVVSFFEYCMVFCCVALCSVAMCVVLYCGMHVQYMNSNFLVCLPFLIHVRPLNKEGTLQFLSCNFNQILFSLRKTRIELIIVCREWRRIRRNILFWHSVDGMDNLWGFMCEGLCFQIFQFLQHYTVIARKFRRLYVIVVAPIKRSRIASAGLRYFRTT